MERLMNGAEPASASVDAEEVSRFAALSDEWWAEDGPMAPLHKLNPVRLAWIKGEIAGHFGRDAKAVDALSGLRILDIGCGGGILTEPLSRMGAIVTGIDPSPEVVAAARLHAGQQDLTVDYRTTTAEDLAGQSERFDVVTALEVVEHVIDIGAFTATCASLVKPGGMMIVSTINRTPKAFLLAIVGAEYVLRWLPRGTHTYDKLVTPDELRAALSAAGLAPAAETGVMYIPFADEFRLTAGLDVNYMMTATRT
jgi:2-polyprenyl-6-hydroxyphenyl methylase/3-demethylubiquinone-9 3-methyltransferase